MQITVVALMCHTLGSIPQPVCREEIVAASSASPVTTSLLVAQFAINFFHQGMELLLVGNFSGHFILPDRPCLCNDPPLDAG
jgi:hypothetical protein